MKRYIILLLLISVHLRVHGQERPSFIDRTDFKIGYSGNIFWNHGLHIGTEYSWKKKHHTQERKNAQRVTTRQLLINGSIGYTGSTEIPVDNGLMVHAGLIWRKTKPGGTQFSFELSPLGYFRSILPEAYEVEGANVTKVGFAGRSYYAPSIAWGIGRYRKNKIRSGWYLNVRLGMRTPYNGNALPILSLEYGHRFNFKKKK